MKQIKLIGHFGVMTSLTIMVFLGVSYGATVTVQREGALQGGQESAIVRDSVNKDDNRLTFAPQRLNERSDSFVESETGRHSVKMERYKPYKEGEGERKIK
jgi:hypothetical protein